MYSECGRIETHIYNVVICRDKLVKIAMKNGVKWRDAAFVFARNIIHGDMLFFPMIARFYDWKSDAWTTLEAMGNEEPQQKTFAF